MSIATISHIEVDEGNTARIAGTRFKVIYLVMHKLAHGSSAEQLREQYPHLSLAQIHAALAYYYDHQAELDAQIQQDLAVAKEFQTKAGDSSVRGKLRQLGHL